MKILHLDAGREMRGGQYQVLFLMEALAARGHRQTLLARHPALRGQSLGWRIPTRGYDLIHAHDARSHTLAALWAGNVPFVVSRRVAFPLGRGYLSRWKYNRAAHFLAVSEYVARQLPREKTTVVLDGVRLPDPARAAEMRSAFRREHNLAPDAFVAGTLKPPREKPVHLFLEAAARRPDMQTLVEAPGDPTPFLFALDVFVYLSESEGLGSGILLAMAHGLPVIASDVGGIPEIVRNRETGLLVRNSAPEVGAALEELQAHPELRRALGNAAREWVARSATDAIMAESTEAVYRKVLESRA